MDNKLIKETAQRLNLPESKVKIVMEFYFKSILKVMTRIRYSELDNLDDVKTNVCVTGFGKFVVSARRKAFVKHKKERNEISKEQTS
jgi:hypothetical protein